MPDPDPRDELHEATMALWGVVNLLSLCDEPVERRGMEYILRTIHDRLEPASEALQDFRPQQ
ncbi:hypothetical protein [uncultured Roseovarius sp.]|uniref:hypothetical protein n=1 Tax=uncultured Roseovarius sp. TaxID=293344 RepID=UPI002635FCD8|nr:hypothetical protein [uncultured Roseovarius sp.]